MSSLVLLLSFMIKLLNQFASPSRAEEMKGKEKVDGCGEGDAGVCVTDEDAEDRV